MGTAQRVLAFPFSNEPYRRTLEGQWRGCEMLRVIGGRIDTRRVSMANHRQFLGQERAVSTNPCHFSSTLFSSLFGSPLFSHGAMLPSALLLRTPSECLLVSAVILPSTPGSHIRVSPIRNCDSTATCVVHKLHTLTVATQRCMCIVRLESIKYVIQDAFWCILTIPWSGS